jgi:hypothetical protein
MSEAANFIMKNGVVARSTTTNETLFVRYNLERKSISSESQPLSKNDHFCVASWPGWICVAVSAASSLRQICVSGVKVRKLDPPKIIDDCSFAYQVTVYEGESEPTEPTRVFYFAQVAAGLKEGQETKIWLAKFVEDFCRKEIQESQRKSVELEKKRLQDTPARLPFEAGTIDHHDNWREVGTSLLRREWLCFFEANDKLLAAKSEAEKARLRIEVWKAYIVDHKALFGKLPELSESDKAELLADDRFIHSLNGAVNRPKSPVGLVTWQLFSGWIVKNYYRMSDKTLQVAFNKDWNYKANQHKGNTLAKRARSLGLLFALKRGRPENPSSLPPG